MSSYRRANQVIAGSYDNCQLLARFDAGNTSTTFVDTSKNALTLTPLDGATQSSSYPWKGDSAFAGASNKRLRVSDVSALTSPGSSDFTLDIRAIHPVSPGATANGLGFRVTDANVAPWHIGWLPSAAYATVWDVSSNLIFTSQLPKTAEEMMNRYNRWTLARSGRMLAFWFNGKLVSRADIGTVALHPGTEPWGIGGTQNIGANSFLGHIGRFTYYSKALVTGRVFNSRFDFTRN